MYLVHINNNDYIKLVDQSFGTLNIYIIFKWYYAIFVYFYLNKKKVSKKATNGQNMKGGNRKRSINDSFCRNTKINYMHSSCS